jgi:protein subunit release factor B|tara:strand:+ start:415 stop:762 length:348 start_codon:yes stop_codon:yes gene_type:complete
LSFIHIPDSDENFLSECKIETFRSSGKGGQHANKTESAVRITHIKSGIQAMCQQERSQYLNKIKCIKELRLRIEKKNYIAPKRIKTKPTRGSIERRLITKKYKSEKKKDRKKPDF